MRSQKESKKDKKTVQVDSSVQSLPNVLSPGQKRGQGKREAQNKTMEGWMS